MEKQLIAKLGAIASALVLAACSSTDDNKNGALVGVSTGYSVDWKDNEDKPLTYGNTKVLTGSNLDTLVIDGKSVPLFAADDKKINGWHIALKGDEENGIEEKVVYGGLSYTRFGSYITVGKETVKNGNPSQIENAHIFAYGQATDSNNVPTSGTATYVGRALYGSQSVNDIDALKQENGGLAYGYSKFNVDFGKKEISGSIIASADSAVYFDSVALKGKISGNSFSGTNDGVYMQGRFFGPKAEELGGTFHKGTIDDYNPSTALFGSFGAALHK